MDNRTSYGATANTISQLADPNQLQAMLRDPQYAGYSNVIIARLANLQQLHTAGQSTAPAQPPVAQQVAQGGISAAAPAPAAAPAAYARGGIVAFRQGGKVRKFATGGIAGSATGATEPPGVNGASVWGTPTPDAPVDPSLPTISQWVQQRNAVIDAGKIVSNGAIGAPTTQEGLDAAIAAKTPTAPIAPVTPAGITAAGATPSGRTPAQIQADMATIKSLNDAASADSGPNTSSSSSGRVRVSGTGGAGITALPAYTPPPALTLQPVASVADMYQANQAVLGPDVGAQKTQGLLDKAQESNALQSARAPWMAVMNLGAGIMQQGAANPRGGFLGALGAAATPALAGYQQQQDQSDAQGIRLLGAQATLGAQARAEQVSGVNAALAANSAANSANLNAQMQGRNTDAQTGAQMYDARLQAQTSTQNAHIAAAASMAASNNYSNASMIQQQHINQIAAAQANDDRANNRPIQPLGVYINRATLAVFPNASIAADSRTSVEQQKLNMQNGTPPVLNAVPANGIVRPGQ